MNITKRIFLLTACLMAAISSLCKQPASPAGDSEEQVRKAILLIDNGAINDAIKVLEDVLKADSTDYPAKYELGLAHYLNGNYTTAIETFRSLTFHQNCTDTVYAMLGNAYDLAGSPEKADSTYKAGLSRFPRSGYLHNELGSMALRTGNLSAALSYYLNGVQTDPDFISCYYRASYLLLRRVDPVAGLILGDIYLSLERSNGDRLSQITMLMADAYHKMLKVDDDTVSVAFPPADYADNESITLALQFLEPTRQLYYEAVRHAAATVKPDELYTETLCDIRSAITDYFLANDSTASLTYMTHLQAVRNSGCENAYNHLIVLGNDNDRLSGWATSHPYEWNTFADWFNGYTPDVSRLFNQVPHKPAK